MAERIEQFVPRNEGCMAMLEDNGRVQRVPVCMGGAALVGCNNSKECEIAYADRVEPSGDVLVIFRDPQDSNIITGTTPVPRDRSVLHNNDT